MGLLNESTNESLGLDLQTKLRASTYIGYETPMFNLQGESNTIIGYEACVACLQGRNNIMMGNQVSPSNRSDYNIFIGNRAAQKNTTG